MSGSSMLEACIPALRRYAWSLLRNTAEADDLVQDCLMRALDHMESRHQDGDLRAWLFGIMHNLSVSRWRRLRTRARTMVDDPDGKLSAAAAQPCTEYMPDVLRGLDLLTDEHRQVLLLVAVEGLEYADVARMLGVPIGTVMSRLSRARDRLRDHLEGRECPQLRSVK